VRTKSRNHYRPTIAVVTGIDDVLETGPDINASPNMSGVIGLQNVLPAILQGSVADQEP
jgi:hypothetical protein